MVGGGLDSNVSLNYTVEFNDTRFNFNITMDTSYLLRDVPPGTVWEVTITPLLPILRLTGPPFSIIVNLGKFL